MPSSSGHKDVDLTRGVDTLMGQRGSDTFGNLLLERKIAQTVAFAADDNAMLHFFSLFQSGFFVKVRARSSGSRFFFVFIIGCDNALHQHMPHYIRRRQTADLDILHAVQHPDGLPSDR